jgi:hypothetical protein
MLVASPRKDLALSSAALEKHFWSSNAAWTSTRPSGQCEIGWSRCAGAHPLRRFVRRGRLGADRVRDLILQAYAEYEEQERGSAAWCILAYRILPRAVLILGVTSLS